MYLAQDTKLDRKVALKILPADLASNRDRMERFVREAKSAAALSHPNIAQIFEIGEHNGTHFIAMELIDGKTLREKIHHLGTCGRASSRGTDCASWTSGGGSVLRIEAITSLFMSPANGALPVTN